ncbi:hypothetical protein M413DRAFT_444714 [Hebeloma cylindrosporum]|uniref:F-box domain-containing protein n=1 Tax=Hebeloma cylindrosporum TaxID=76867 RepID=A0A0C3CDI1_HEBCY|nr:hypothetical protein M413DRAFT_444714 [Hebeloma cylindrosporum h7]
MPEPKQPPFLSLPPELIESITDELDTNAVKDLRLSCKQLGEHLNSRVFRELTIGFTQMTYNRELSKVRILATTDCHAASSGTRTLRITSLSPTYDPGYPGPSLRNVGGEWVYDPIPEDPPETRVAEEELKGYLFKAIASLRSVHSVEWKPANKDAEWAQKDVMAALKTLHNLRVLNVETGHFKFPLPIHDLSNIQEISVHDTSTNYSTQIFDNLAKLVSRNPKITSIDIAGSSRYSVDPIDKNPSLHWIFENYPQKSSPLRLHQLSLTYCFLKLDSVTLPHLQHLTSLSLITIQEPYSRRVRWRSDGASDLERSKEKLAYGSSLDDVWKALKLSRIYLQELVLDVVVPSLLDYLASYSGLKKLWIIPGIFRDGSSSDSMASQFFLSTSFINHVQSLEDLSITAIYEGFWCFGPWNEGVISRCTKLKALKMAIVSVQLYPPEDADGERNVIDLLIDAVSNSMPQLETLVISTANAEGLRGATCGNPAMQHFARVCRNIVSSINEYRAPPSCHRLPRLIAGNDTGRAFVPRGPDEDGRLGYLDTTPSSRDYGSFRFF